MTDASDAPRPQHARQLRNIHLVRDHLARTAPTAYSIPHPLPPAHLLTLDPHHSKLGRGANIACHRALLDRPNFKDAVALLGVPAITQPALAKSRTTSIPSAAARGGRCKGKAAPNGTPEEKRSRKVRRSAAILGREG